jgi:hypothetical protein
MSENFDARNAFIQATSKYLEAIEIVPFQETEKKSKSGKYQYVSIMTWFKGETPGSSGSYMIPVYIWEEYLQAAELFFKGLVNRKVLQRAIESVVESIDVWPMTEEAIGKFTQDIFRIAEQYSGRTHTAFVPIANVIFESRNLEIPLAKAILRPGSSQSRLAELLTRVPSEIKETDFDFPEDSAFLEIAVQGDQESIAQQTRNELRNALIVLRYISPWGNRIEGTKRTNYNPASSVRPYPDPFNLVLYNSKNGWGSVTLFSKERYRIDDQLYSDFLEYYGLADINFHFNAEENEISERVVTALEWYDSAVLSETNWKAVYRYVSCINAALSGGDVKTIKTRFSVLISTLIDHGEYFIGTISTLPDSGEIDNYIEELTSRFEYLYNRKRGNIVHGYVDKNPVTEKDIKDARILAHNTIRLFAKLAKILGWKTDKEAEMWFKKPTLLPPSQPNMR